SGPVNSVQTYCGLEIAIIAIKPSTSCIQRVDAVEPRASARVVVIANPPMITPAATTIGPVPGCRQGQQSGNGAKYTAFSKRAARLFPIRNGLKRWMARPVAIFDQCVLRRCSSIRAELSELPPEIGREGLVHVGRDRMPAGFDCNAARHAAAGEEIQHRRARKRQRADDPPDKFLRLLGRMADAFFRIAVEARDFPDIGGIDALVQILGVEPLVALVDLERMRIERLPHGVEVEIVFWRPGKPGDLLMPVGEEALRTHAVRVIPDDEI